MISAYPVFSSIHRFLIRHFPRHGLIYLVAIGMGFVIGFTSSLPGWMFWGYFAWTGVIALHFLYVKSVKIEGGWVDERTQDLRSRSYDLGHIQSIEDRVKKDDPSVRPADRRE